MLARNERLTGRSAPANDVRREYQRDRDRVLYTAQFRRLSGITQVTTPNELYVFHNRLTHTLEVAQIARRIAERVILEDPGCAEWIDPDVCETAGLAHDLGHPPFGHNGESTLDELAIGQKIAEDGFEGNAQSLRILLKLAIRTSDEEGLDLTAASLRATVKYPWTRAAIPEGERKFGFYSGEEPDLNRLWEGLPPGQRTLEAEIMDWSDDVAYSTHDFYDFSLAGLIPIAQLKRTPGTRLRDLLEYLPGLAEIPGEAFDLVSQMLSLMPDQSLHTSYRLTGQTVGMLKQWTSFLITRFASEQISVEDGQLVRHGNVEHEIAILKAITTHFAIESPALAIRREGENRVLKTLLDILTNSANSREKRFFNDDARERISQGESPGRIVLDTISSMTDAQALSMFHKLTGISPIAVTDMTTLSSI